MLEGEEVKDQEGGTQQKGWEHAIIDSSDELEVRGEEGLVIWLKGSRTTAQAGCVAGPVMTGGWWCRCLCQMERRLGDGRLVLKPVSDMWAVLDERADHSMFHDWRGVNAEAEALIEMQKRKSPSTPLALPAPRG